MSVYKLPALVRAPREGRRTIRPLVIGTMCVALSFLFGAPAISSYFDQLSGVQNLAITLSYCFALGMVYCAQVLVAHWRLGPEEAQAKTRRITIALGIVLAIMWTLFTLGPHPTGKTMRLTVELATEPHVATLLFVYLTAYLVGIANFTYQCWAGAKETPDDKVWLRRGTRLCAIGSLFTDAYAIVSLIALISAWFGRDPTYYTVVVAPGIASLGIPEFLVAISIVAWGPRVPPLRAWVRTTRVDVRDYRKLGLLWRALRPIEPTMVHRPESLSDRLSIEIRLFWRIIEINDWLLRLAARRDTDLDVAIRQDGGDDGIPADEISAAQEAARAKFALAATPWTTLRTADIASDSSTAPAAQHAFATERRRLVMIADAFGGPIVDRVVNRKLTQLSEVPAAGK
jgi:hypothetical protein